VRDLRTGALHDVSVRRKVVDTPNLEESVPATHTPAFEVASGARVVPINDLPTAARSASCSSVLVPDRDGRRQARRGSRPEASSRSNRSSEAERIRWVRRRDAWFHRRADFQPLEQVGA